MINKSSLKEILNNLKKGVQIGVLGAALTAGAVMGTGCAQPTDTDSKTIEKPNNGDVTYGYDKTIGNYGSNYNMHNFMGETPTLITDYTDKNTQAKTAAKSVNAYLSEAKTYTENLADKLNQSLNGRPAAQNYFNNIINTMKSNSYFHIDETNTGGQNFDSAVTKNAYPCNSVFADIIKNLDNTTERETFQCCYRILANETYKEGLGNYRNFESPLMDNYNQERNELIALWYKDTTNIDLANIYGKNDIKAFDPITDYTDRLLGKAVNNINAKRNLDLKVADMQQFINISLTAYSLEAMHDYSKNALQHNRGCGLSKGFVNTMQQATKEAWQEEQQYQQLYQNYLMDR